MARTIKPLNMQQVASLKPRASAYYQAVDNDGLYVRVRESGKYWTYRTKDRKWVSFGSVDSMSLAQARLAISERKSIDKDCSKDKRLPLFKDAADAFIKAHEKVWKSEKHLAQWNSTLQEYAYPVIGKTPIDKISANQILEIVDAIGARLETARRVRGRIKQIIDATWIIHRTGVAYSNPAQSLVIGTLRPGVTKKLKRKHHEAISVEKAPGAFKELMTKTKPNVSYAALCFLILTAGRSNEIAGSTWNEVKGDLWIIPSERMKAGREHIVPLSDQAQELLRIRGLIDGQEGVIFPNPEGAILSDASMRQSLKRSCGAALTVHGWRSTFRDWATENDFNETAIEMSLAHLVGDETVRAYRRGDLLNKRRAILQAWANFLTA